MQPLFCFLYETRFLSVYLSMYRSVSISISLSLSLSLSLSVCLSVSLFLLTHHIRFLPSSYFFFFVFLSPNMAAPDQKNFTAPDDSELKGPRNNAAAWQSLGAISSEIHVLPSINGEMRFSFSFLFFFFFFFFFFFGFFFFFFFFFF